MDAPERSLIIKSPNDKIPSYTVIYEDHWSVEDLKQHLFESYETHPPLCTQRLIHSGKLLKNETLLRVLLKDPNVGRTMHLVCRSSNNENNAESTPSPPANPMEGMTEAEMEQYQRQYLEYLQRFYMENSDVQGTDGSTSDLWQYPSYSFPASWPYMSQWGGATMNQPLGPHYYYTGMGQSYQAGPNPPTTQPNRPAEGVAANVAVGRNQWLRGARAVLADLGVLDNAADGADVPVPMDHEPAVGNAGAAQAQQAMMVGNPMAGGFMGGDEFGENGGNLDVVDRFYMTFRLILFIGLCCAYSSLDKAIIVFSVAAYVYFYNIYRRHAALRRAAIPAPAPEAPHPVQPPSETAESPIPEQSDDQQLRARPSVNRPINEAATAAIRAPPPPPAAAAAAAERVPRLARIASSVRLFVAVSFQFVSSLITSLIPEQPPPLRLD